MSPWCLRQRHLRNLFHNIRAADWGKRTGRPLLMICFPLASCDDLLSVANFQGINFGDLAFIAQLIKPMMFNFGSNCLVKFVKMPSLYYNSAWEWTQESSVVAQVISTRIQSRVRHFARDALFLLVKSRTLQVIEEYFGASSGYQLQLLLKPWFSVFLCLPSHGCVDMGLVSKESRSFVNN